MTGVPATVVGKFCKFLLYASENIGGKDMGTIVGKLILVGEEEEEEDSLGQVLHIWQ